MEKKTIGSFIAALRKANGMTQKELAERLNVSDKTISRWERDDGAPDLSAIPVIAEVFGVTCDELLRGQRKSPEQQEITPENTPTPKGEKERKRLLQVALSRYKTRSLIALCLALVGLLVAMAFNFGFNRAYLGLLAGCVFYLAATACQIIFVNHAFLSIAEEEDTGDFRRQVIGLAEIVWLVTAVLFAASLPLILVVHDSYAGLLGGSWLRYGSAYGFSALNLCAGILWLVNGRLVKREVYAPKANFAHNRRWQKYCAVGLVSVLAMTALCQWGLNQFGGPRWFAEWHSFEDVDSFIAYMEQDVEYNRANHSAMTPIPEAPDDAIIYYDPYGNVISEEQALTDHLYEGDQIVASYVRRNETVQNIRYSIQNGEVQFLEVLTWDEYYRSRAQLNVFNTLFGLAYVAEYLIAFWFYLVKRKKA